MCGGERGGREFGCVCVCERERESLVCVRERGGGGKRVWLCV